MFERSKSRNSLYFPVEQGIWTLETGSLETAPSAKQSGLSPAFSDRGAESPAFPGVHGSDSEPETGRAGLFSA